MKPAAHRPGLPSSGYVKAPKRNQVCADGVRYLAPPGIEMLRPWAKPGREKSVGNSDP